MYNTNSPPDPDSIKERFTRLAALEVQFYQLLVSAEETEHELFRVASGLATRAVDDDGCDAAKAFDVMCTRLKESQQRVTELRDQWLGAHGEAEAAWHLTLDALAKEKGLPPQR